MTRAHHFRFTSTARERVRLTPNDAPYLFPPSPWSRGEPRLSVRSSIEPDKDGWRWTNEWLNDGHPDCSAYSEWHCPAHPSPGMVTGWHRDRTQAELTRRRSLHLMNTAIVAVLAADNHRTTLRYVETLTP